MKRLFITIILLPLFSIAIAQKDIAEYGKIEKADLEMKSCDFDKDAEALVLFDVGEFFCNADFRFYIQNERHIRIKILKDKGLERANIHIRYFSLDNEENVKNIAGETFNLDPSGNIVITRLDKKLIYKKEINKRYSEISFTLPEVKAGSVIEYKYTIEGSDNGSWYFQKSIPVKLSRFTVDFPNLLEMNAIPHTTLPLKKEVLNKSVRDVQVYTMENVPALRDEPFILCDQDYLQSLKAIPVAVNPIGSPRRSLLRSWPQVITSLMEDEDFGLQLKRNVPRTSDLDAMLKDMKDPYKKMVTIHEYVRKNMEWNGYDNIWALSGVRSAWKDKKGTSGEINLILVNLLKDAGINAHPLLVSTRDHGKVNTVFASSRQFDKVMAYIEMNDRQYVLDATEKITPSRLIPLDAITSEAMVIEKIDTKEWGWKTLWNGDENFNNLIIVNGEVDKDDVMKGEATISSTDYARVKRMPVFKEGKKTFTEKYFTSQNPNIKIDSLSFENEQIDSMPLIQHAYFNQSLSSSGNYKYFTANMFTGLEKNPFLADNRFSDIFFGYNQHIVLIGNFTVPDGYQFEELPKNIKMIMPDTGIVFTRLASEENGLLSVKITLDLKKPFYSLDEYPGFKDFYKKLFDLLNEQFVYRKKS